MVIFKYVVNSYHSIRSTQHLRYCNTRKKLWKRVPVDGNEVLGGQGYDFAELTEVSHWNLYEIIPYTVIHVLSLVALWKFCQVAEFGILPPLPVMQAQLPVNNSAPSTIRRTVPHPSLWRQTLTRCDPPHDDLGSMTIRHVFRCTMYSSFTPKTIYLPGVPCTNTVAPNQSTHTAHWKVLWQWAYTYIPLWYVTKLQILSANSFYRYRDLSGKVLQPGAISYLLSDLY